jgi:hypothetical protein
MIIIMNNDEIHFFLPLRYAAEPCLLGGGIGIGGIGGCWLELHLTHINSFPDLTIVA